MLVAGAVVARLVLPGLVVKLPTDLAVSSHTEGVARLLVSPVSLTSMPRPVVLPVSVEQQVRAVDGTASTVVVREEETQRLGPVPVHSTEQFVLDRRTARNLDSPQAVSDGQHVDRAPFFSSGALPFHVGPGPYEVWKNEVAAPYPFVRTGSVDRDEMTLSRFQGTLRGGALVPQLVAELGRLGFPGSVSVPQLATVWPAAAGTVDSLRAAVPLLTPADRQGLVSAVPGNVPLRYTMDVDRTVLVERTTGIVVGAEQSREVVNAAPDLSALQRAAAVLARVEYAQQPRVSAATAAVRAMLAHPPAPVAVVAMEDRPESVSVPAAVKRAATDINRVEWVLPLVAGSSGVLLVVVGILIGRFRGRRSARLEQLR